MGRSARVLPTLVPATDDGPVPELLHAVGSVMGRRHPNPRLVKIHRNYTVDEAAVTLGVHKNTVRNWQKLGLESIDAVKPGVILGWVLREFLERRRVASKRPCAPGHLYCMRCRSPREPALGMVDLVVLSPTQGNLTGICPDCESVMNQRVRLATIDSVRGGLEIQIRQAESRIADSAVPSVNCDSKGDRKS